MLAAAGAVGRGSALWLGAARAGHGEAEGARGEGDQPDQQPQAEGERVGLGGEARARRDPIRRTSGRDYADFTDPRAELAAIRAALRAPPAGS